MSKIVGIDLGTTNSLVATVDSGIPYVIADAEGRRLTPSVVHWPGTEAPPLVGQAAQHIRQLKPAETIYSAKRFMGRRGAEIEAAERNVTYPVQTGAASGVTFPVAGRKITPEEVAAEVLKKLRADAEAALGEPVTRAVITVPAYFNDAQRNATKRAGEQAGLTVERIINEPTAAALAYGLDKLQERAKIAVYDLGGGTFDLSILELNAGVFQVLATHGNTRLGGDDLDHAIVMRLAEEIVAAGGPDLRPAQLPPELLIARARVREAAEGAKIKLSTEARAEIALPFLTGNFSFQRELSREELETLARPILERTHQHCRRALADAKLEAKQLDQVVLVGGQTRMPLVRQLVSDWFGCAEFEAERGGLRLGEKFHPRSGPLLNTGQNPDEAVALGAAIQAEILSGGFQNVLLLDVTPLSLGLETFGGLMNVLIPRNSTIPVKAGEMFTTAMDQQRSMLIHVLQGERERAKDNWSLGKFTLEFAPAARGLARVGVQFEIDANGILKVLARDVHTGQERIVTLQSAVDVDDAAVTRMVEESVAHAFEDLTARRWVEQKLKAQELSAATEKGLASCGDELAQGERDAIAASLTQLRAALATESSDQPGGNLEQLRAACQLVDTTTKPLADLLMDRAMEALLRKRGAIS